MDTTNLRKTSEVGGSIPWRSKRVPFVLVKPGLVRYAKHEGQKLALLDEAGRDGVVLVAWPGEWSQDVFLIDDINEARRGLAEK